jgi:hypothetical protein
MYFLPGEFKEPTKFQAPPDTRSFLERGADQRSQFSELIASSFEQTRLVEASNNDVEASLQAYENRFANIKVATGVQLLRPMEMAMQERVARGESPRGVTAEDLTKAETALFRQMQELQGRFPQSAGVIRADEPIVGDMRRLQQGADSRLVTAEKTAKDLSGVHRTTAQLLGGIGASFRDPVNIGVLAVQPEIGVGRTLFGKIASRALTEGAINGGAEAAIQTLAEDGKRKAGLRTDGFWKQVGIAAAFGGGLGGLAEGGGHVLKSLGRNTPDTDAALARMAAGDVSEADARLIADAAGVKVDEGDMASLSRAMEADADTAAVLRPEVDERQLADAVRAIETDAPLPRVLDEVDETHVPPGLRKTQQTEGQIPDNAISISEAGIAPENVAQGPSLAAFVDTENAARLSRLEDFVAMNEADIAHLRDDGALDAMPSERDFSNVRGASDEHRASIVLVELENKVAKTKAEIAAGPKHSVDDAAVQIAYAKQQPQALVQPELRTSKLATPASPEAVEAAARKLEAAGGAKVKPLDHTSPKAAKELVKRDTLDIMDALPGGTDANGNPISTTHAELSGEATRMNDLADLIASCKA